MYPQLTCSRRIVMAWLAAAGLLFLTGCAVETPAATAPGPSPAAATPSDQIGNVTNTPPAAGTPGPAITVIVGATASTSIAAGALPASATPAPGPTTAGQDQIITLNNNGQTITLHPGERFSLQLGEDLEWAVTSSDPAVLGRVVNILTVRGSQGVYEARAPGQATLSAIGDAACRKSKPPCMLPSRAFAIQVIVQ